MADVRCPMCGKPNPAEADTCRYCQARLKPLNISAFDSGGDQEVPDWLRSLRGPEEPAEPEGSNEEGADWLSRLGGQEQAEPQESAFESAGDGDGADWLAGLTGFEERMPGGSEPKEEKPAGQGSGELSDWLSSLKGEEPAGEQEPLAAAWSGDEREPQAFTFDEAEPAAPSWGAEASSEEAGGLLDWLSSLKGDEPAAAQEPPAADWLSGGSESQAFTFGEAESETAEPAGEPAGGESGSGLSDWLSGFMNEEPATAQEPPAADWLSGGSESQAFTFGETQPADAGVEPAGGDAGSDLVDWLSSLKDAEPAAAEEPLAADWLSGESGGAVFEPGEAEASASVEPALPGEMPDWLSGLQGGAQEPAQEVEAIEPSATGEVSDWFASIKGVETPAREPPAALDWLSNGGQSQPFNFDEAEEVAPSGGAMPDWLSGLDRTPSPAVEPAAAEPASDMPDWLSSLTGAETPAEPAGEVPDWLGGSRQVPGVFEQATAEPASTADFAAEAQGTPDWLSQIDKTQAPLGDSVPAFTMEEGLDALDFNEAAPQADATEMALSVPDWISQVSAEPAADAGALPGELEPEAGLAQANLPDWLEAMRPVESLAPDSVFQDRSDDRLESAGPLAGLRGIIPVEAAVMDLRKPPAYALKIPIAEDQQARLNLLQEVLASESSPITLPVRPAISSQMVLRLVVFVLIVVVSIVALWNGLQTPLPVEDETTASVAAAQDRVDALRPGMPVLVVMDYEPGFADEMQAVVMPVINHLAGRGVYLTFVSTSPTGPIMVVSLMDWLNQQPVYLSNGYTYYTNLGFLAGGINGIQAFAKAPADVLPRSLDGNLAWMGAPLDAQLGLGNFELIVVASDDPEGARQWIEQVGPLLQGDASMVLLTSAQAGPLVQPYYAAQSGSVTGLVSGMRGGAAYQNMISRSGILSVGTVVQVWDAYSLAMNVVVVFIVLGGLFSLGSGVLSQRKAKKGEANA